MRNKDLLSSLQSFLTIIGLVLAGFWFFGQHAASEKLKLQERISYREMMWNGRLTPLLWIEVWATNVGSTPIGFGPSRLAIDDLNPDQESGPRVAIGSFAGYKNGEIMRDSDSTLIRLDEERTLQPLSDRLRSRAPISWFFSPDRRPDRSYDVIEPGETDQVFAGQYLTWSDALTVEVTADLQGLDGSWWRVAEVCDLNKAPKIGESATCPAGN